MQASECCIIRVSIAASLGWLIAITLMWKHGVLAALIVSPLFGTAAAIAAMTLFWFVSLFVSCEPIGPRASDTNR
ncbi:MULTISPECIES: hypothetical protein [Methylobacterium]|jgi:hypothetical protein|uniref:hypothetical protein n=1 Tax=Methylobacterium TaxID=407 RepID=UPI00037F8915|nr:MULTISPECIES: hypothetical protein [Methylobacterium]MBN4097393.1 hypothetical protein [Methylobacterium sp. OT2]UIN35630.1 hypothetical protein LXM90_03800 [Methylobacterium oryzae]SEF41285.1 hypothetical protein SAMN04488144_101158 [Methylobacterium sp. 190mf]SEH25818.1 hypothetical protein SAMN02799636_00247 [Methylobacterium sp. 275MFSha3.1]SEN80973.1 hypothetical protein SAMN02799625_01917 [Methylobacterium sp. UNC300MFChir4.1]